ncbi:MAG TPA: hypothetical protein DDW15_04160 [Subdoligranulum sp.]|nr:hypothetical protein [Subdoligranulum sp.]
MRNAKGGTPMAKISVIVPAYNAETTLRTAVESILSQQVPELEIIIVNDGSTDGTDRLCHALASEYPCIHVITQKNAGICAARNRGMEAANGEYITFCDDDDLFWQGALRLLLQTAEDTRADLVRGGYELLRQRPDGTFAEQPHPAGSPCTIALGRGGSYGAFLENSGPQFVWNALYRRTALLGLRFNERCSYGLEDFVFNAAAYRRVGKAVYIPQVVYRHFESAQSTSCAHTAQALLGRIRALEPWMEAEFHAAQRWCGPEELQAVWKDRRAQAVTFLMHQLRDAHAPGVLRRKAWRTLREALAPYPGSLLDTLHDAGHNKKQTMALLLYQMRLQKLYDLLPVREEQL